MTRARITKAILYAVDLTAGAAAVVTIFAGLFAVIALCWFLAGTGAAVAALFGLMGLGARGMCRLYQIDRDTPLPEEDWQQVCAQEGANIVSLRGRG